MLPSLILSVRNTIIKKVESLLTLYNWRSMMTLYKQTHRKGPMKPNKPWYYICYFKKEEEENQMRKKDNVFCKKMNSLKNG